MSDLFKEKALSWDNNPLPAQISQGVGDALERELTLHANMQVMDFGAGTGLICGRLAPRVKKIYAVDISEGMLEKLRKKPELKDKVQTLCQNILTDAFEFDVDLIVSAMALHHVQDTHKLVKTFSAALKPGGKVALADLDKEDGSFHPAESEGVFHQGFDRNELQEILKENGFEEIRFSTATTIEKEGKLFPIFLVTAKKS